MPWESNSSDEEQPRGVVSPTPPDKGRGRGRGIRGQKPGTDFQNYFVE